MHYHFLNLPLNIHFEQYHHNYIELYLVYDRLYQHDKNLKSGIMYVMRFILVSKMKLLMLLGELM
jgi:hypothetical protein